VGFRNAGAPCPEPAWTPDGSHPVSHTIGERVQIEVDLTAPTGEPADLLGMGPDGIRFERVLREAATKAVLSSTRPLRRRIAKVPLAIRWSLEDEAERTENVLYATMARPAYDEEERWPEDGVTVKRMDRAVSWVAPLRTLVPHAIVRGLMRRFPFYALRPSPDVPRRFHHPTYFNDEGGAWPMSDYVGESGECQAIVRLVRAMLRQLGVPGEARTRLVWADPEVDDGKTAVSAYLDDDPGAGLDKTRAVEGKRWLAALVDQEVEEGKTYPASHTLDTDGNPSPGLNRFEACLEFTYGGRTLLYGGGAGVYARAEDVLPAFWGLVWVSPAQKDGFRVEQIVRRYR
jgi:hypothetical protein